MENMYPAQLEQETDRSRASRTPGQEKKISEMTTWEREGFIQILGLMEDEIGVPEQLRVTHYEHRCYLPAPGISYGDLALRYRILSDLQADQRELEENVKARIEEEYQKEHYGKWLRLSPLELVDRAEEIAGIKAVYDLAGGLTVEELSTVARYKDPLQIIADFCSEWDYNEYIMSFDDCFQQFHESGHDRELEEAFRERDWEAMDRMTPEQAL